MLKKNILPILLLLLLCGGGSLAAQVDTLRIASYNLLNFPNGRDDCGANVLVPARWDTLRLILDDIRPSLLMVCELQTEAGADSILRHSLNTNGVGTFRRANFVLNRSSTLQRDLNNMLFYDSTRWVLHAQSELITDTRDIGYYRLYVRDNLRLMAGDTVWLDCYVGHLKASLSDSLSRRDAALIVLQHIAQQGAQRVVFGGDFNFYSADESGYIALMQALRDPVQQSGVWSANASFAAVHTQATRSVSSPFYDCGAVGGMDDRFDFLLLNDSLLAGSDLYYISNSYRAWGNNGSTYNTRINAAANTSGTPAAVLNALFHMSDHLPVVLDLALPQRVILMDSHLAAWQAQRMEQADEIRWRMRNVDALAAEYYEVEYSEDAMNFEPINRTAAQEGRTDYDCRYLSAAPVRYYRLAVKSRWLRYKIHSRVVAVTDASIGEEYFVVINPASESIYVRSPLLSDGGARLLVFDLTGRLILQQPYGQGEYEAALPVGDLPAGLYLLRLEHERTQLSRLIMVRR